MKINYWDCPHRDYDEAWDGEEEWRTYGCTHPHNKYGGRCDLDNKYGGEYDDCVLITEADLGKTNEA